MTRATFLLTLALLISVFPSASASIPVSASSRSDASVDVSAGAGVEASTGVAWNWPVEAPHPIIRPYIAPETPYSAGHRGIDIGAGSSTAVRAPTAGVVHFAGTVVDRSVLSIRHPGGLITSYEPVVTTLARGDPVARGEVVGELQPGHCSVPCLHFGVRLDDEYVSPLNYLGAIPRAILLPTRKP